MFAPRGNFRGAVVARGLVCAIIHFAMRTLADFFSSRASGYLLALLAVAFWGGNFVVARAAAGSLDPIFLSFLRWLVACVLLAPFAVAPVWRARKKFIPHWRGILSASIYGVSLFNTFIYLGGEHSGAADLAMVAAAAPIFIVCFAVVILRETISGKATLGIVLATIGVVITTRAEGGDFNPTGTLWSLASAASFAAYSVGFRRLAESLPFFPLLCLCFFIGTLFLVPLFLFRVWEIGLPELTLQNAILVGYPAVFASLGSFFAWSRALSLIGATHSGYVYYLVPVFAGLQAWWILDSPLSSSSAIAMGMILLGVFLSASGKRKNNPPHPKKR